MGVRGDGVNHGDRRRLGAVHLPDRNVISTDVKRVVAGDQQIGLAVTVEVTDSVNLPVIGQCADLGAHHELRADHVPDGDIRVHGVVEQQIGVAIAVVIAGIIAGGKVAKGHG